MRVLPGRESIVFVKQGKVTPLLQKTIQKIEKRKDLSACNAQAEKYNTQKIIKI